MFGWVIVSRHLHFHIYYLFVEFTISNILKTLETKIYPLVLCRLMRWSNWTKWWDLIIQMIVYLTVRISCLYIPKGQAEAQAEVFRDSYNLPTASKADNNSMVLQWKCFAEQCISYSALLILQVLCLSHQLIGIYRLD
jgi:hypothetical protein